MPEHHALTLAYMRAHPAEAALTLDTAPSEPVAALLLETPARIAAPVLAEMSPAMGAEALRRLPLERAAELLAALGAQASIALLRHVPEAPRQELLALLPTSAAVAIRLLLGFPGDSVGSIAEPAVVTAPPGMLAGDALRQVRAFEGHAGQVLLLDESQRLVGWLALDALLRAPESAPLSSLATMPPALLPAQMPLAGALQVEAWARASVLPVVERGGRLVGLLTRDALVRAAARANRKAPAAGEESLAGALAESYLLSIASLLQVGTFWFPRVRSLAVDEHGR